MNMKAIIALEIPELEHPITRRIELCLRFAKNCLTNEKTARMFPLNQNYDKRLRNANRYEVKFAHNNRTRDSAISPLQCMLNAALKLRLTFLTN